MTTAREHSAGLGKLRQTYELTIDGWIRPSGNGWRFTDNQGRVYRLDDEDGPQVQALARAKVDELFSSLEGQVWYMLIPAMLVSMLGIKMLDELAMYGAMPTAVYFAPCLLFLFKDVINEVRFAWEMNKWRGELAVRVRQANGREHETAQYSLLKDDRMMVWIGWALLAPGLIGFMLFYESPEAFFLFLCMSVAGAFVLRTAYGVE
jgi:hypothetical protein